MPVPKWTYSGWIELARGTPERLTKLRQHIHEVSDAIYGANYSVEGKSHERDLLQRDLADLRKIEEKESASYSTGTSERRTSFTRGVPLN